MCIAVPMRIEAIDGLSARCSARGAERVVSLDLLHDSPLCVGDWLLVHVGRALKPVSAEEAHATWEIFDLMLETPESPHRLDADAQKP